MIALYCYYNLQREIEEEWSNSELKWYTIYSVTEFIHIGRTDTEGLIRKIYDRQKGA